MESYNYNNYVDENKATYPLTKVFGYMFLGLGLTAAIAFGLFFLLASANISPEVYIGMLAISSIGIIVMSIVTQLVLVRGNAKGGLISYIIYTVLMGVMLSSLFIGFDMSIIGYAFLCAAGSFGAMALYGIITKRETSSLGMIGVGLLFGVLTLTLVNFLLRSEPLYWIITYVGLIAMLMITAWDVNRAKRLSENGMLNQASAIFFALQIYTDFVYIFIRIVEIIARAKRN